MRETATVDDVDHRPQLEGRVKVLYVLGWGRSGSTLLDNILGQIDGYFSAGELHYLWERGLLEHRKCGCSRPVNECPVWRRVLEDWEGFLDPAPSAAEMMRMQYTVARNRNTPRLLWGRSQAEDMEPYLTATARLYESIARVTGARVIVDSSKRIPGGVLLGRLPNLDPYFVHVIRDPRAVAYSWQRSKSQPESKRPEMRQFSPFSSSLRWTLWTLGAEAIRRRHPAERSMAVTYEGFMAAPRETVRRITELVGEVPAELPFTDDRTVVLEPTHTVSGNPSRFHSGPVELRSDEEWRVKQPLVDRVTATALTLVRLRRYGYPISVRGRGP